MTAAGWRFREAGSVYFVKVSYWDGTRWTRNATCKHKRHRTRVKMLECGRLLEKRLNAKEGSQGGQEPG